MALDPEAFKGAMRSFPSGVIVAITVDAAGKPWGFTASAFSSVSMAPPLVLVCLGHQAASHAAFKACERLSINILAAGDEALAMRFATRGSDKFGGDDFVPDAHGVPLIRSAVASLSCRQVSGTDHGDHLVLVAEVDAVRSTQGRSPMVYAERGFWRFASEGVLQPA